MRVLLINPQEGHDALARDFKFYRCHSPPLGILYIAKVLEETGHIVEVIDFAAEEFKEEKILKNINSTDFVGLTINAYNVRNADAISRLIKQNDQNLPIIIGGPICSIAPKQILTEINADMCLEGEGEKVIDKIVNALEGKEALDGISGLYFKKDNTIKHGPAAEIIENLDSISFPARHLVDKYEYGYAAGVRMARGKYTSMITSRGCPYNCKFCCVAGIAKKYRKRSVENIMSEFGEITEKYDSLIIMDDNFLADRKSSMKIIESLIHENYDLDISIMGVRLDAVDEELLKKMKRAGVTSIFLGLESGNQDVLDFYNKGITLNQMEKTIRLIRKFGLNTIGNFIVGAPIETNKHLEKTYGFAKRIPLNTVTFTPFRYLKGSELWKETFEEGKIEDDEYVVETDPSRRLGNFSYRYLEEWCERSSVDIMFQPSRLFREFFNIIARKDFYNFLVAVKFLQNKLSGKYTRKN